MMQVDSDPNAIPSGCVRCEYLESNTASLRYIDTERLMLDTDTFGIAFTPFSNINGVVYGWRRDGTFADSYQSYMQVFQNYLLAIHGYGSSTAYKYPLDYTEVVIDQKNQHITVNGGPLIVESSIDYTAPYLNGNSVYTPLLFSFNIKGTPYTGGVNARIHDYWVKNKDGKFVQHLVPILDKNGVACMYDTVAKKFHYNKGNGQFLYKILEQ